MSTTTTPVHTPAPTTMPASPTAAEVHEHGWITRSRHTTSEGVIVYVACAACSANRVDLISSATRIPSALTGAFRS